MVIDRGMGLDPRLIERRSPSGAPADPGIFQLRAIDPSPLPLPASGARANSSRFCDKLCESLIILGQNLLAHPLPSARPMPANCNPRLIVV
jgi:hypothetical protein